MRFVYAAMHSEIRSAVPATFMLTLATEMGHPSPEWGRWNMSELPSECERGGLDSPDARSAACCGLRSRLNL